MIEHKCKRCNSCGKRVAVKYTLLYTTEIPYVTVRGDDVPWLPEDNTVPYKLHYCQDCWDKMWKSRKVKAHAK